jgi:hypothetical protein
MTCHNNIKTPIVKDTKEMQYWYKYMNTCIILNSWDTITHAENGADKDSDSFLTTNEEVILNAIEELPAIMCVQKVAKREIVTEEHLIQANKNSFGDEIGSITNRITSMFSVIAKFSKDSPEYKELEYRITCGQNFQQNAIDKTKGIISKPMPKEWYDFKVNEIHKEDDTAIINRKRFNLSILADKKPYFFNYIYPIQMKKYKTFIDKANKNCLMRFGLSVEELKVKKDRTEEEERFLTYYNIKMPVEIYPSTMNKICWRIEQEFDDYSNKKVRTTNFDSSLLTDGEEYSKSRYAAIKQLYEEYQRELKQYSQTIKNTRIDADEKRIAREIFKQDFKRKALEICNNEEELCNIVIDLCYRNNSSKQFAWDISGKTIIKNLLKKNSNIIHYPTLNKDGEIEFGGYRFSMQEKVIESEVE